MVGVQYTNNLRMLPSYVKCLRPYSGVSGSLTESGVAPFRNLRPDAQRTGGPVTTVTGQTEPQTHSLYRPPR